MTAGSLCTAGAAEWWGDDLGEFVDAGVHNWRPFYRQRDTEGNRKPFLYFKDGCWRISLNLGDTGYVKNCQDTGYIPPRTNWEYLRDEEWIADDPTLTSELTILRPCQLVRVAGTGDVMKKSRSYLGDFRFAFTIWLIAIDQHHH